MPSYHFNEEPNFAFATMTPVYKTGHDEEVIKNPNFLITFDVYYTTFYKSESGRHEDLAKVDIDNYFEKTLEFDKTWLISGDKAQIQTNVYLILEMINVPCYKDIVKDFIKGIFDLKKPNAISVDEVKVFIHVTTMLPLDTYDDYDEEDDDEEVTYDVPPANDEAVANHLVTVVVENDEEHCVICMENIRVESDMAAARMPCKHVFHRTCVEDWLRYSGICPVCRTLFLSEIHI